MEASADSLPGVVPGAGWGPEGAVSRGSSRHLSLGEQHVAPAGQGCFGRMLGTAHQRPTDTWPRGGVQVGDGLGCSAGWGAAWVGPVL